MRVDKSTVVGHQEQAGGVVVETAHRLHITAHELFRQQRENAAVTAGFTRAFIVRWFIQRDVQLRAVTVRFSAYAEFETIGFDRGMAISDELTADTHFTYFD